MYTVSIQPNFVHYLAEHTFVPENALLHICVYNPLIDPYLTEIYQNFQKGVERENLLLIVLPPLRGFEACLLMEKKPCAPGQQRRLNSLGHWLIMRRFFCR